MPDARSSTRPRSGTTFPVELRRGQTLVDLPLSRRRRPRGRGAGCWGRRDQRPGCARRAGRRVIRAVDGCSAAADRDDAGAVGLSRDASAGHSGRVARPALVGDRQRACRPGLVPRPRRDRRAISAPAAGLRPQSRARSSRHDRDRGASPACATAARSARRSRPVVRNRDHENWTWGMSPWPPEGEPSGKGTKPVTLPRPGHADLAGVLKFGLDDARDALERASARATTAVTVAAGAGREGATRGDRHRGRRRRRCPRWATSTRRRGGPRHRRRRRRGARARRAAGPRLVRVEGGPASTRGSPQR